MGLSLLCHTENVKAKIQDRERRPRPAVPFSLSCATTENVKAKIQDKEGSPRGVLWDSLCWAITANVKPKVRDVGAVRFVLPGARPLPEWQDTFR